MSNEDPSAEIVDFPPVPAGHAFLAGGGVVGEMMRQHDWSKTGLGMATSWPQSLRTTISLMLNSQFAMFCAWGDDLTLLYNDAYIPMLADKHPMALGEKFEVAWADIWDQIKPLVDSALAGDAVYLEDMLVVMNRRGYTEETYWTFSYSPVRDETGAVGGMFCACTETTKAVKMKAALAAQAQRQARMLEQAPGFMAILSGPEHTYEYANAAYNKISLRPVEIGRTFAEVFPELLPLVEVLDTVYASGERVVFNHRLVTLTHQDGPPIDYYLDFIFQPLTDTDGMVTGVFIQGHDATAAHLGAQAQARNAKHLRLLVDELNHRVKNTLSIIQSLAQQTFKGKAATAEARAAFDGRLIALASAHDLITRENWEDADLEDIVNTAFDAHGVDKGRILIAGTALRLEPKSAVMIAMALHELTTNACKYGALSTPEGRVTVTWDFNASRQLSLRWAERDGPGVTPPARRGFGTRMIEKALAAELRGAVNLTFAPTGVICEIEATIPNTIATE